MEEEDTEKALTMLIERMSAVAAAGTQHETTADPEMKEVATSTSTSSSLHSGELIHISIKSRVSYIHWFFSTKFYFQLKNLIILSQILCIFQLFPNFWWKATR